MTIAVANTERINRYTDWLPWRSFEIGNGEDQLVERVRGVTDQSLENDGSFTCWSIGIFSQNTTQFRRLLKQ